MKAKPQNIEQANFEGRRSRFGVRMLGVLRFVIQPFSVLLERTTSILGYSSRCAPTPFSEARR